MAQLRHRPWWSPEPAACVRRARASGGPASSGNDREWCPAWLPLCPRSLCPRRRVAAIHRVRVRADEESSADIDGAGRRAVPAHRPSHGQGPGADAVDGGGRVALGVAVIVAVDLASEGLDGVFPIIPGIPGGIGQLRDHAGRRHSGHGVRRSGASPGAARVLAAHRELRAAAFDRASRCRCSAVGSGRRHDAGQGGHDAAARYLRADRGTIGLGDRIAGRTARRHVGADCRRPPAGAPGAGASSTPREPWRAASSSRTSPSPSGCSTERDDWIVSTSTPRERRGTGPPSSPRICRPRRRSCRPAPAPRDSRRMLTAFRWNLRTMSYATILVGAFLIYNTISAYIVRRRQQIGIVRAVGASQAMVRGGVPVRGGRSSACSAPRSASCWGGCSQSARSTSSGRPSARST